MTSVHIENCYQQDCGKHRSIPDGRMVELMLFKDAFGMSRRDV